MDQGARGACYRLERNEIPGRLWRMGKMREKILNSNYRVKKSQAHWWTAVVPATPEAKQEDPLGLGVHGQLGQHSKIPSQKQASPPLR
jgi:hypothetical protein